MNSSIPSSSLPVVKRCNPIHKYGVPIASALVGSALTVAAIYGYQKYHSEQQ